MRLVIVGVPLLFVTTTAVAQSRWMLSAGPEWTTFGAGQFYGARVRAEYDLVKPTGPLRLRLESGGFWSPTQDFYKRYVIVGGEVSGARQVFDLTIGLSAALTPLPKARFSPYVVMAAVARQSWTRQSGWRQSPGAPLELLPPTTNSVGDMHLQPGVGIRARIAGRVFQLEWRPRAGGRNYGYSSLTFGTHLPF